MCYCDKQGKMWTQLGQTLYGTLFDESFGFGLDLNLNGTRLVIG